jgi:hypothetical protein
MNCDICGKPASLSGLKDLFGKSDARWHRCPEHQPSITFIADPYRIPQTLLSGQTEVFRPMSEQEGEQLRLRVIRLEEQISQLMRLPYT